MLRTTVVLFILIFAAIPLSAEYLFLTDGSIIKGRVVNETPDVVNFRVEIDDQITRYPRREVLRVLYTEIYMGRVYVQMRTGEVHRVFMVDEDRTTYTFRKELYEPAEFKVVRKEVLFMSERNPTGLGGGEPGLDWIELRWLPSFEKMRYYNVYYKKKGDNYGVSRRSFNENYLLRGLDSNTEYTVKVTGYAGAGDETIPSNEFTFRTQNMPPGYPRNITRKELENGEIELAWDEAVDPDGEVVLYRIYMQEGVERTLIGETKKTAYKLKGDTDYSRVKVVAVDDMGAESGEMVFSPAFNPDYTLTIMAGIIYPWGVFADLAGFGYGGAFTFTKHDLFFPGLEAGIYAGFYYLTGVSNDDDSEIREVDRSFFVPAGFNIGYRIKPWNSLSFVPYLTGGFAMMDVSCRYYVADDIDLKEETLRDFGPAGGAGLVIEYEIGLKTALRLILEQGFLFKSGITDYPYTRLDLGMAIKF